MEEVDRPQIRKGTDLRAWAQTCGQQEAKDGCYVGVERSFRWREKRMHSAVYEALEWPR